MFEQSSTDQLEAPGDAAKKRGVSVLYISPLKALGIDVERNLQRLLLGIQ